MPAWCIYLLRFQVAVVYVNAGLAKATADWLLHAQPLNIWLSARTDLPVVGPYLDLPAVAYAAAWAGFLFDTTIAFFLLWRRTRPFAYVVVLAFHVATHLLFPRIGMFPVIMVVAALVFFDPSWPRAAAAAAACESARRPRDVRRPSRRRRQYAARGWARAWRPASVVHAGAGRCCPCGRTSMAATSPGTSRGCASRGG